MRSSQTCEKATSLEADSRDKHFADKSKIIVKQSGKMIGEQYKIAGIAQAYTIRNKRNMWTFMERSLQQSTVTRRERVSMQEKKRGENGSRQNTHIVVQVKRTQTL